MNIDSTEPVCSCTLSAKCIYCSGLPVLHRLLRLGCKCDLLDAEEKANTLTYYDMGMINKAREEWFLCDQCIIDQRDWFKAKINDKTLRVSIYKPRGQVWAGIEFCMHGYVKTMDKPTVCLSIKMKLLSE